MRRGERQPPARGFTYVWVLMTLAVLSVGLAALGPAWSDSVQREREAELLRIGALYAQAIAHYRDMSPGSAKTYPPNLEALLSDQSRFVGLQRHLRRLYADPMDPDKPWGLVRGDDGTIRGVYSTSDKPPFRREPIDLGVVQLPAARRYSDWRFVPQPRS